MNKVNKEEIIKEILGRGTSNVIPNNSNLEKLLLSDKVLNVYMGIDPTATKLHIGHCVPLRKLHLFTKLNHNVILVIGDFTALIGDTSDKDKERPILTIDEIKENFKTYKEQASKILDFEKVTIKFNSEWLGKLKFVDIVKLCQHFSVGDFVNRTLIKSRLENGKKVGLHETLYPVMQGYDSLQLNTDIQIGGADQTFNMQAGRNLIKDIHSRESFVLVTEYLEGLDGNKMSKTGGNAIWMIDTPEEVYGKIMSIPDNLIEKYFYLSTKLSLDEIDELKSMITNDPMNAKKKLAFVLTEELHTQSLANVAQTHFEKTFQKKSPEFSTMATNMDTLVATIAPFNSLASLSEAKRLISSGAVEVDGVKMTDPNMNTKGGQKIKIGKKLFLTVK